MPTQHEKAAAFAKLHESGCFILPNAWDVPSAALIAEAGFPAIATTSSGIAFAHGFKDGERIGTETMFKVVSDIAKRIPLPVTGDLEAGYGGGTEAVAQSVRRAIQIGLVGANIEDTDPSDRKLLDFDLSVKRIQAGVQAARDLGLPDFVLNARTDPILVGWGASAEERFNEAARRARAYFAAGAKSVFVPGLFEAEIIGRMAAAIAPAPLNIMTFPRVAMPSMPELRRLGLRRLTLGGALMLSSYGFTKRALESLRGADAAISFNADGISHAEMTALMEKYPG